MLKRHLIEVESLFQESHNSWSKVKSAVFQESGCAIHHQQTLSTAFAAISLAEPLQMLYQRLKRRMDSRGAKAVEAHVNTRWH